MLDHPPGPSSTAPASLKGQDVVSLVSSLSSVMMSDSSLLVLLLSLSFLLGVWLRETTARLKMKPALALCRNCHRAQVSRGGSSQPSPQTSELQHHQKQIKRKLYVHPSVDNENTLNRRRTEIQTTTTQPTVDPKLIVTRPRQIYKVQDLVPPSFFVHQNSFDYFEDPQPATYQSFLVRKFNLKPVQEIMQSKPAVIDGWEEEREESEWLRGSNLEENQAAGTWAGSTDWLKHWIE